MERVAPQPASAYDLELPNAQREGRNGEPEGRGADRLEREVSPGNARPGVVPAERVRGRRVRVGDAAQGEPSRALEEHERPLAMKGQGHVARPHGAHEVHRPSGASRRAGNRQSSRDWDEPRREDPASRRHAGAGAPERDGPGLTDSTVPRGDARALPPGRGRAALMRKSGRRCDAFTSTGTRRSRRWQLPSQCADDPLDMSFTPERLGAITAKTFRALAFHLSDLRAQRPLRHVPGSVRVRDGRDGHRGRWLFGRPVSRTGHRATASRE